MALICANCGTVNHDPGGDPRKYSCGACGQPNLHRTQTKEEKNALAAAIAGGAILGMAGGGPIGVVVGAIVGAIIGSKVPTK